MKLNQTLNRRHTGIKKEPPAVNGRQPDWKCTGNYEAATFFIGICFGNTILIIVPLPGLLFRSIFAR